MFVVVIFHLFYVLVKFVLYLWWELNLKVIPVKYGWELTHYKLESNISTKQLHVLPTTAYILSLLATTQAYLIPHNQQQRNTSQICKSSTFLLELHIHID